MAAPILCVVLWLSCCVTMCSSLPWARWEERTMDCTSRPGRCRTVGGDGLSCREEQGAPPSSDQAQNRTACPLGCQGAGRLSVTVKRPYPNDACVNYYTYGHYHSKADQDWYFWIAPPCVANLTTWCQFNDGKQGVPFRTAA